MASQSLNVSDLRPMVAFDFDGTLTASDSFTAFLAWRVIVTASPELTVAPFARDLGADALIGTRLALDPQDRIAGGFLGENCRGPEKVRRLREAFGPGLRLAAAYGDTSGDRDMLAIAEVNGYRVFKAKP
jgi:phosphatidylglycerophosphatase C